MVVRNALNYWYIKCPAILVWLNLFLGCWICRCLWKELAT